MKRKQVVALVLVVIMAVAMVPAAAMAQTPAVGQLKDTPKLTIKHWPDFPYRGEKTWVWGKLSWQGNPIKDTQLTVWYMLSDTWQWHPWPLTVKTDEHGNYEFTVKSTVDVIWFKIRFEGDANFAAVNSYEQILIGWTTTTLSASTTNPGPWPNTFDLSGWVIDGYGVGVGNNNYPSNVPVQLFYRPLGTSTWKSSGLIDNTNGNGKFAFNGLGISNSLQFYARFNGHPYGVSGSWYNNWFWHSHSNIVTVYA